MRRICIATAALLALTVSASAQSYPNKPIHMIIPFGAGSATDVIPRIVFERLSTQLGQTIVVENRPGAGATIGATAVAKADADGYTMLTNSSAHTLAPALYSNLNYDVSRDFTPVGMIGMVPNVLIVSPARGLKSLKDFVAEAKAKPGSFTFASLGIGSAVHMSAERFRYSAGYEAVHVPFKGGAEALTEVVAGRVDYYFCPIATALPFIQDGRLIPLAVSSPTRAAALPDVPTTLELGFPDSDYTVWIGVFAPAKTPADIITKFNAELAKAVENPETKARLAKIGVETRVMTPEALGAQVAKELPAYAAFANKTGMKAGN